MPVTDRQAVVSWVLLSTPVPYTPPFVPGYGQVLASDTLLGDILANDLQLGDILTNDLPGF